ncbi:MAG: polyphosphate polymerase domain-containing protein [Candidatus Latescibacterota bacterium]|jgi:hypothetical protein
MDVRRERREYKYLIPEAAVAELGAAFSPFVEPDDHARCRPEGYTVHSIYLDTPRLTHYHEKLDGIRDRRKVRVRGYDEGGADAPVFLEIKHKHDMAISKSRARLCCRDLEPFLATGEIARYVAGPDGSRDRTDAGRVLYQIHRHHLRPVILIHYRRQAFFRRFDPSVRITFDHDLRSTPFPALDELHRTVGAVPSLNGNCILEVKFHDEMPPWLERLLTAFGLDRTSLSKYTICLDEHGVPERLGVTGKVPMLAQWPTAPPALRPPSGVLVEPLWLDPTRMAMAPRRAAATA